MMVAAPACAADTLSPSTQPCTPVLVPSQCSYGSMLGCDFGRQPTTRCGVGDSLYSTTMGNGISYPMVTGPSAEEMTPSTGSGAALLASLASSTSGLALDIQRPQYIRKRGRDGAEGRVRSGSKPGCAKYCYKSGYCANCVGNVAGKRRPPGSKAKERESLLTNGTQLQINAPAEASAARDGQDAPKTDARAHTQKQAQPRPQPPPSPSQPPQQLRKTHTQAAPLFTQAISSPSVDYGQVSQCGQMSLSQTTMHPMHPAAIHQHSWQMQQNAHPIHHQLMTSPSTSHVQQAPQMQIIQAPAQPSSIQRPTPIHHMVQMPDMSPMMSTTQVQPFMQMSPYMQLSHDQAMEHASCMQHMTPQMHMVQTSQPSPVISPVMQQMLTQSLMRSMPHPRPM